MTGTKKTKYVHEGRYVAVVEVELLEDDTACSPYVSAEDAYRLDDVRTALRRGDLESAGNTAVSTRCIRWIEARIRHERHVAMKVSEAKELVLSLISRDLRLSGAPTRR